ncbi:hypothetical protein DIPPA_12018 [Diplonema papillatum]|nr:hypothetical protein DIPPA_12018 [Diplonema papillatum]
MMQDVGDDPFSTQREEPGFEFQNAQYGGYNQQYDQQQYGQQQYSQYDQQQYGGEYNQGHGDYDAQHQQPHDQKDPFAGDGGDGYQHGAEQQYDMHQQQQYGAAQAYPEVAPDQQQQQQASPQAFSGDEAYPPAEGSFAGSDAHSQQQQQHQPTPAAPQAAQPPTSQPQQPQQQQPPAPAAEDNTSSDFNEYLKGVQQRLEARMKTLQEQKENFARQVCNGLFS